MIVERECGRHTSKTAKYINKEMYFSEWFSLSMAKYYFTAISFY